MTFLTFLLCYPQFLSNKDEEQNEQEEIKKKLLDQQKGQVKCRLCKEDHWTKQCPYKDKLEPLRSSLLVRAKEPSLILLLSWLLSFKTPFFFFFFFFSHFTFSICFREKKLWRRRPQPRPPQQRSPRSAVWHRANTSLHPWGMEVLRRESLWCHLVAEVRFERF